MSAPGRFQLALVSVALLGACHNAPPGQTPALAAEPSHAVGDSSAFGTTLKWTGEKRREASVGLTAPAHVVLLEVWPDGQIAAIHSNLVSGASKLAAGSHAVGVGVGSFERFGGPSNISALAGAPASDLRSSYTCVRRQEAARIQYVARTAPSTGSVDAFGGPVNRENAAAETRLSFDMVAQNNGVLNCDRSTTARVGVAAPTKSLGSAAGIPVVANGAERKTASYLVALASDVQISAKELNALVITEGDIQSIVQAVGKKLYGSAPWSASFIRW